MAGSSAHHRCGTVWFSESSLRFVCESHSSVSDLPLNPLWLKNLKWWFIRGNRLTAEQEVRENSFTRNSWTRYCAKVRPVVSHSRDNCLHFSLFGFQMMSVCSVVCYRMLWPLTSAVCECLNPSRTNALWLHSGWGSQRRPRTSMKQQQASLVS